MRATYEAPSAYVPAGAAFDGPGPIGIEALFGVADAAGAGWTDALGDEDVSWSTLAGRVHRRKIDGDVVWGLLLPEAV